MEELTRVTPRPSGTGELFQLLRDGRPRTRSDLATATGQSRSTIATRVDLLLASGLITGEAIVAVILAGVIAYDTTILASTHKEWSGPASALAILAMVVYLLVRTPAATRAMRG